MAPETLCLSNQVDNELGGENRIKKSDHAKPHSSLPCSHSRTQKAKEVAETLPYSGGCTEQSFVVRNDDRACNSQKFIETVSESGGNRCILDPGSVIMADGSGLLHDEDGIFGTNKDKESPENYGLREGTTLQNFYFQDQYDDDEDDDDIDWQPVHHLFSRRWFCRNCTVPNSDEIGHCYVCGENEDTELSGFDAFHSGIEQASQMSIASDSGLGYQDSSSKQRIAIGFDERMLLHYEVEMKSNPHPERPDRIRAIAASLANAGIFPGRCSLIPSREITEEELRLVHSEDHVVAVQQTSIGHSSYFTSDTYANKHSSVAAGIAAALCADLAVSIVTGCTSNGFALVRPPGHHAGIRLSMGFCLHNNAAVAALAAQRAGAKKVLIVDWDVHHGNGTQEIFEENKSVLYVSLHRHEAGRFYPGTGGADQVGTMDGKGYSVNVPWSCGGVGDNDYIFAFQNIVLPIASEFGPDIIIISAGFDAARGDPLGCCDVTPAGYAQMTHMLTGLLPGRVLAILEGGYNLRSISSSATEVVKVLLGENPGHEMNNIIPSKEGFRTVLQVLKIQFKFWPILKSRYDVLHSEWKLLRKEKGKRAKRFKHSRGPIWWKWGSKKFVYKLLYGVPFKRRKSIKNFF